MPFADVNGQKIHFTDSGGDGPAIILSHGFMMSGDMFVHQVAALDTDYRVITWDERGFGLTEFDGQPFTYWDSAADCIGLLDHLGIERAVLGGMSQGGFLSLRAALTEPDRVRALILLDSQAGGEDPAAAEGYKQMIDTWIAAGPIDELTEIVSNIIIAEPAANAEWIAKWKELDERAGRDGVRAASDCLLGREDITDRLGEITCPALVVHGTEDTAITMDLAEIMAEGLPGSGDVVKVSGAHAANLTNPEPVNEAIVSFLAGIPG
ncbi:MAG: alpha/beta fold hydrolase [Ilumatobacter sp.]